MADVDTLDLRGLHVAILAEQHDVREASLRCGGADPLEGELLPRVVEHVGDHADQLVQEAEQVLGRALLGGDQDLRRRAAVEVAVELIQSLVVFDLAIVWRKDRLVGLAHLLDRPRLGPDHLFAPRLCLFLVAPRLRLHLLLLLLHHRHHLSPLRRILDMREALAGSRRLDAMHRPFLAGFLLLLGELLHGQLLVLALSRLFHHCFFSLLRAGGAQAGSRRWGRQSQSA
mmetsp:Transcript_123430/g.356849  ORF Transcript_123430/g.356849 Transcript_123430/m.356849 type:complete len:229 (-) Transcript_123430:2-688(-)